jgi:hypothetical protein
MTMWTLTHCNCLPQQAYNSSNWVEPAILAGDPLAAAIANNATLRRSFFWVTHTFTHQNLNNATYSDARCVPILGMWHVYTLSGLKLRSKTVGIPQDGAATTLVDELPPVTVLL